MRLGFCVGWNADEAAEACADYRGKRYPAFLDGNIFPQRSDAETVLAAERLKQPTLDWAIFEVHDSPDVVFVDASQINVDALNSMPLPEGAR